MTKISRYREAKGPEATAQPGSRGRVMLNRLGLTSKRALDQAEALALERSQEEYYARITVNTRFTAALLRQMHRDWLGDIISSAALCASSHPANMGHLIKSRYR